MALVNIGQANQDDGFYRYKMPRLLTKIEGRGNGIKTNIVNMVDVAKALARPPSYTTKFFGCVLGAQSKFDEKTGTATVNGAHDTSKIVQLLEVFIKKYVQCYGCGNPETEVVITKTQMINLKCAACGFVSDVDMRDKLTTFILNNPPEAKKGKGKNMRRAEKERLKAGEALDKKEKVEKKSKADGPKKGSVKSSSKGSVDEAPEEPSPRSKTSKSRVDDGDDDSDVEWHADTSEEAARSRVMEQLSAATTELVVLEKPVVPAEVKPAPAEEESPSSNGKSVSKVTLTPSKASDRLANGKPASNGRPATVIPAYSDDGEDSDEEDEEEQDEHALLVAEYADLIKSHKPADVVIFLRKSTPVMGTSQLAALLDALVPGSSRSPSKELLGKGKPGKAMLSRFVTNETVQLHLLEALEYFFLRGNGKGKEKEIVPILKGLYDEDVLEEEQIMEWHTRDGSNATAGKGKKPITESEVAAVKKHAQPFVTWLEEAESEESDDDEE